MRRFIFVIVLLCGGHTVDAQTIDSYEFRVYDAGATAPRQTTTVPLSAVQCNQSQPAPFTGTPVNPKHAYWDDPVNVGRACHWDMSLNPTIPALPVGSYDGKLVAVNTAGSSPESNPAPFVRLSPPSAVTTFRLRP